MGKIIPLKCNGCGHTVGAVREVNETDDGLSADMDMKISAHGPDCPIMAVLARGAELTGISIGPYENVSGLYKEIKQADDVPISANIFLNEEKKQ